MYINGEKTIRVVEKKNTLEATGLKTESIQKNTQTQIGLKKIDCSLEKKVQDCIKQKETQYNVSQLLLGTIQKKSLTFIL